MWKTPARASEFAEVPHVSARSRCEDTQSAASLDHARSAAGPVRRGVQSESELHYWRGWPRAQPADSAKRWTRRATVTFCKRFAPGAIVRRHAMACPPKRRARLSFRVAEILRAWAKMKPWHIRPFESWIETRNSANHRSFGEDSESAVPVIGPHNPALGEIYQRLYPEMRRPKPNQEAIAAALQAMQRLTMEADSEICRRGSCARNRPSSRNADRLPGLRTSQPRRQQVLRRVRPSRGHSAR